MTNPVNKTGSLPVTGNPSGNNSAQGTGNNSGPGTSGLHNPGNYRSRILSELPEPMPFPNYTPSGKSVNVKTLKKLGEGLVEDLLTATHKLTPENIESRQLSVDTKRRADLVSQFLEGVHEQHPNKLNNVVNHLKGKFGPGVLDTIETHCGYVHETAPRTSAPSSPSVNPAAIGRVWNQVRNKMNKNLENSSSMGYMFRTSGAFMGAMYAAGGVMHAATTLFISPSTEGLNEEQAAKAKSEWRWRNAVSAGVQIAAGTAIAAASLLVGGKSGGGGQNR